MKKEVKKSKIVYSVTPTKAKSVSEAVASLNALKGVSNRTAIIGGLQQIPTPIPIKASMKNSSRRHWTYGLR